ncbi:MAG TPA: serine hydrolase domain-containing protein [Trebonia sp.]|nr:serine hydrolase domain-containing protein [Trebonia sp.]
MTPLTSILEAAREDRQFSGAAYAVGTKDQVLAAGAVGTTAWEDGADVSPDTVWDIASVTKPIVAIQAVMMARAGQLSLADPVSKFLPEYRQSDKAAVTLFQLLTHTSGIPGQQPLYRTAATRPQLLEAVRTLPLRYSPGTGVEYSSQGFMIVGQILEAVAAQSLDTLLAEGVLATAGMRATEFCPAPELESRIAATEWCPWRGRLVKGSVHDENAAVLGGVAGHAGLFSTAGDLSGLAQALLGGRDSVLDPELVAEMAQPRTDHLPLRRCLGWQGADPTGCPVGSSVSPGSYGHTGFTGTSLWVDPHRGLFVILLTNAVHPKRRPEGLQAVRSRFHDAVFASHAW